MIRAGSPQAWLNMMTRSDGSASSPVGSGIIGSLAANVAQSSDKAQTLIRAIASDDEDTVSSQDKLRSKRLIQPPGTAPGPPQGRPGATAAGVMSCGLLTCPGVRDGMGVFNRSKLVGVQGISSVPEGFMNP